MDMWSTVISGQWNIQLYIVTQTFLLIRKIIIQVETGLSLTVLESMALHTLLMDQIPKGLAVPELQW